MSCIWTLKPTIIRLNQGLVIYSVQISAPTSPSHAEGTFKLILCSVFCQSFTVIHNENKVRGRCFVSKIYSVCTAGKIQLVDLTIKLYHALIQHTQIPTHAYLCLFGNPSRSSNSLLTASAFSSFVSVGYGREGGRNSTGGQIKAFNCFKSRNMPSCVMNYRKKKKNASSSIVISDINVVLCTFSLH